MPKKNNKSVIRGQMNEHGLKFNKALGQNFLSDENVLNEIVLAAKVGPETNVLEIGPGGGALTSKLASVAKKVVAVEIDKSLIPMLSENLSEFDNIKIINEDVLNVSLGELFEKEFDGGEVKVVANLPYYITTPIIMKLLDENPGFESLVVMVQKEVADRLIATPGGKNCGAITYSVNYACECEKVVDVPPEAFVPAPKVWSSVIKLVIRSNPPVNVLDKEHLFNLVKTAFSMRRKTLLNCISHDTKIGVDKEEFREILKDLNISENVRGEALTLVQFSQISNKIKNKNL
ncbi:MAG: 16S rRNA (adenine(1518)-N(6)/adenine(1519)-N(6))-dimethyltransferase RsmA [Clostridia bacterium]|nr:16S rRNA (adenine(1518)-N(6)/adenine(1519)-N(6))-dimethyltransferase RsmA [Clostridia bacterium]